MANSTSIYRIMSELSHNEILEQFHDFRYTEETSRGTRLTTSVNRITEDIGYFKVDIRYEIEDGPVEIEGVNRWFPKAQNSIVVVLNNSFIIVWEPEEKANYLISKIQGRIFGEHKSIFNLTFSEPLMANFVQNQSSSTPVVFLSGLDNPDRNAGSHFGANVKVTREYLLDLQHSGTHVWAQFVVLPERWMIGLRKSGGVVFYTKVEFDQQLDFIRHKILNQ